MSSATVSAKITQRFHNLLISYDFARQQYLVEIGDMAGESADERNKRELLEVELSAKENRDVAAFSKAVHLQEMTTKLNQEIEVIFEEKVAESETIVDLVTGGNDAIPAILDILSVRSASIARIEPLVTHQAWLSDELIRFVNLPQYRSYKNKKKNIKVDKAKTAISYVGLENLPYVIPSFALKKWIPYSTEPFRLMKRKLWEGGLSAAICCRKIAQLEEADERVCFVAGMFHDLGKSAIVRLYFRIFDDVWKKRLTHARDNRLKEEHDALVELTPDPSMLRDLLVRHSQRLSAQLIEDFNFKRFLILPTFEDFASDLAFDNLSKHAQIMSKGIAYARYKALQKHNLISKEEAKTFFKENHLAAKEILELRKLSLKRLNLRLEQQ